MTSLLNAVNLNNYNKNTNNRFHQRYFSKYLSHIDDEGKAKMVDVDNKKITKRYASAKSIVYVGPKISQLIRDNDIEKGDVLSISQIAGIISAKKTSDIIPLCHNIPLSSVNVKSTLDYVKHEITIITQVKCEGKTGVEMEALTSASVAALTIYDMCKAVSHDIIIKDIRLMEKYGGKVHFKRDIDEQPQKEFTLKYKVDPIIMNEPFYPTHI